MNTKERIIDEALTLFSVNGYKGTSVKQIADAVGIKDSSLYKHYKSKQEILDTIIEIMRGHITTMAEQFGLPSDDNLEMAVSVYSEFDEESFIEFSKKVFLFYLTDSYVSRFWKMGNIERYKNQEVYAVYSKLFFSDSITYLTDLFKALQDKKVFVDNVDAKVMAVSYYSPIFFLLSKHMNVEANEESLRTIGNQSREFCRIYKI